jgi:hypothetical protein
MAALLARPLRHGRGCSRNAAASLAIFKQKLPRDNDGRLRTPPKQNKQHKQRSQKQPEPREPVHEPVPMPEPLAQPPMAMATAVAMPVLFMVHNAPFVAATPLPMLPLL